MEQVWLFNGVMHVRKDNWETSKGILAESIHDMFSYISSLAMGPDELEERLKVRGRYEV